MEDPLVCRYCLRDMEDCGGNCAGENDQLGLTMEQAVGRLQRLGQLLLKTGVVGTIGDASP